MALNEYKSFYIKDLLALLNEKSIEMLREPNLVTIAEYQGTAENVTCFKNSNIALYNHGIMQLRSAIREALMKEAEEEG